MTEEPNYFSVIPAEVRYAKISSSAKLFYGELTALAKKNGYCYASNAYFSKLYEVSRTTISLWVKELKDNNFIKVEFERNGQEVKLRKIYIGGGGQNSDHVIRKFNQGDQKTELGWSENLKGISIDNKYMDGGEISPTDSPPTTNFLDKSSEIDYLQLPICLQVYLVKKALDIYGWGKEDQLLSLIARIKKAKKTNVVKTAFEWLCEDIRSSKKTSAKYNDFSEGWGGGLVDELPKSFKELEEKMNLKLRLIIADNPNFLEECKVKKEKEYDKYNF
jgi:DNA-binding transcriptional ArsR family regulator